MIRARFCALQDIANRKLRIGNILRAFLKHDSCARRDLNPQPLAPEANALSC